MKQQVVGLGGVGGRARFNTLTFFIFQDEKLEMLVSKTQQ
jgi:hypothetical protein